MNDERRSSRLIGMVSILAPQSLRAFLGSLLLAPVLLAQNPTDPDGRAVDPFAPEPGVKAIVLVFAGPECPISNRLAPDLIHVQRDFQSRGVRFFLVYPEREVDAETARRHASTYGYPFPVLLDHGRVLVEKAQATVLSEAAVFSPAGELLYQGRINDRILDFGTVRPAATREDLRLALEDVLAGRPVSEPRTQAIGCIIQPPSWSRDVAPVLYRSCVSCHRPNQVAPFSLLTYGDAARRAEQIAFMTSRRLMPPWKPEPGHGRFRGERRLTEEEIARLRRWAEAGAPEGDSLAAPKPPELSSGWQLGEPDLVVAMQAPFLLAADGPDVFRNFVLPVALSAGRYVEAIELRADNPRVIHHATILLDPNRHGRELDAQDPEAGFAEGMLWSGEIGPPAGHFLAWTPGRIPTRNPESWGLPRGSDLVLEAHLLPTGKPEEVRASLGLYFTDRPPARRAVMLRLGTESLDIPAGEADYRASDRFLLPVDVEILSIYPHAHYLGREVRAFATRPDGTREPLIWIKRWDFNWQDQYEYEEPLFLPAGTVIELELSYDNSAANLANPNRPPVRVRHGPRSTDEMGNLWLQAVPRIDTDYDQLDAAVRVHYSGVVAAGLETRLRETPKNAELRAELADRLARQGKLEKAAEHYRKAVAERSNVAWENNLAAVLTRLGLWQEAIEHYRAALRLDPGLVSVRLNLAAALIAASRLEEAVSEVREVLRLEPEHLEARRYLTALEAARR